MGSQAALDSGNKQTAKALQYTSIGLSAIALIEAGVAIAPTIYASSLTTDASLSTTDASSLTTSSATSATTSTVHFRPLSSRIITYFDGSFGGSLVSSQGNLTSGSSEFENSLSSSIYSFSASSAERVIEPVDQSLSASGESQINVQASASSISSTTSDYMAQTSRLASPASNASSSSSSVGATAVSAFRRVTPDDALYTRSVAILNSAVVGTTPSAEVANTPLIPGAIATDETVYTDMSGANAALLPEAHLDELSGTNIFVDM
jgi:hypothetical protein